VIWNSGKGSPASRLERRARRTRQRLAVFRLDDGVVAWPVLVDTDIDEACEIGSVTKVLTGLLVAAADAGRQFGADTAAANCSRRLDVIKVDGRDLTLADLATHHGGLPRLSDSLAAAPSGDPYRLTTSDSVVGDLARWASSDASTATRGYSYSNFGYAALGQLVAERLDVSWELAVQQLLSELGVDHVWPSDPPNGTPIGTPRGRRGREVGRWHFGGYSPAGGLWATAAGLADLSNNLLRAYGDPEHTLHLGVRRSVEQARVITERWSIGLGWNVVTEPDDGLTLWHNGATAGSIAFIALRPAAGTAVGMVGSGPPNDDIEREVAELL